MTRESLSRKCLYVRKRYMTEKITGSIYTVDTKIEWHLRYRTLAVLNVIRERFIEIFIKCRGNIKEVERELGISYPTVKSRLEDAANALGYGMQSYDDPENERRMEILDMLEKGLISVEEALELLK